MRRTRKVPNLDFSSAPLPIQGGAQEQAPLKLKIDGAPGHGPGRNRKPLDSRLGRKEDTIRVSINVSAEAALLEGKNFHGEQIIEIDPADLTQEEREELANSSDDSATRTGRADFCANKGRIKKACRTFEADIDVSEPSLESLKALLTPRPHIRRAHWHSYWIGPRKGPQKAALKWLSPILVGDAENLVPTIRDVDEEQSP